MISDDRAPKNRPKSYKTAERKNKEGENVHSRKLTNLWQFTTTYPSQRLAGSGPIICPSQLGLEI